VDFISNIEETSGPKAELPIPTLCENADPKDARKSIREITEIMGFIFFIICYFFILFNS